MPLIYSYPLRVKTEGKALFVTLLDHLLEFLPGERVTMTRSTRKQILNVHPTFRVQRYASSSRIVS